MTAYPRIVLPLFSHGCLVALVLSLGTLWETALCGVLPSPSVISGCWERNCHRQRLLTVWTFLFVLGHFFLLSVGLGLDMGWAGVTRFFSPTNIITYFENLTVELHVFYTLSIYVKFCVNRILFTIWSISLYFMHNFKLQKLTIKTIYWWYSY